MKQSPEMLAIQENMLPGKFSAEGFLGDDARNLTEILFEDQRTVDQLGVSHGWIAERLGLLTDLGKEALGMPVCVLAQYEVTVEDYMGRIPCPFRDNHSTEKRSTTAVRMSDNKTLIWTDLSLHMIEAHGFYQGQGSPYRLEPAELVAFLQNPAFDDALRQSS